MSNSVRYMVYSAITEAQAWSQFEADAARAAREGYEPVTQSWDGTTLTVTYQQLRAPDPSYGSPVHDVANAGGGGIGSAFVARPVLAAGAMLLVGLAMVGGIVLLAIPH